MALGFGFNKAKALASAEKFVQQGKLQNAIAEYEKIVKEDAKDLTVLNTLGDLCARVGQNDQAAHYFRKVGEQYAEDGFTVKAIAVYKKLTRLSSGNFENIGRLAELYSQQGLFSDARAQYMQVADHLLRSGDNSQAARVFQRILELDPENTNTQSKLADLYLKLGKRAEACKIYYTAAETLYARASFDAADEALNRLLALDPQNAAALLLRGKIAAESGDSPAAVQHLERVSDLDSRPEGLHSLLQAKLKSGLMEEAEEAASKLATAHKDLSGISELAQWYVANNQVGTALKLYDSYADRFIAGDRTAFEEAIHPLISHVKNDPQALSTTLRLLEKAGDSSHNAEIMELQAHAFAQKGDYKAARDLYKKLSEIEPENSLHSQNYKQMLSKLGEDPATRVLSPEEAAQAFMVEELEQAAPAVHQSYDPPTEKAIEAALTDAELFVSYNVPAKAIPPLESVLPMAPRDVTVNQRLATLYARAGRYADAARACQVLSEVYRELGHETEASRYLEAARNYALRAPGSVVITPPSATARPAAGGASAHDVPAGATEQPALEVEIPAEQSASSVQEFSFDVPDHLFTEPQASVATAPTVMPAMAAEEMTVRAAEPIEIKAEPAQSAVAPDEIDVSSEWEGMLAVESGRPGQTPVAEPAEIAAAPPEAGNAASDKINEAQLYISQEMWEAAKKAILDLTEIAPDAPEITDLIAAVSAGQSRAATAAAAASAKSVTKPAAIKAPSAPTPKPAQAKPAASAAPAAGEFVISAASNASPAEEFVVKMESEPLPAVPRKEIVAAHAKAAPLPAAPARAARQPGARPPAPPIAAPVPAQEAPLENFLTVPVEISAPPEVRARPPASPATIVVPPESPLEDILEVESKPAPAAQRAAAKAKSTEDILTDFVADMEKSELADFVPRAKLEPKPPAKAPAAPIAPPPAHVAAKAPARSVAASVASPAVNGDMGDAESASVLGDILSELQEETAEGAGAKEDPETHYNLGIAFKEMGLLDEAIGELQKVCHAMDGGSSFSQPIQAYTWLAQCLVDKGAPEAAVRWYKQALQLPRLDDGSRCAIYYDLALAYEASGDKKSALANFMEVYGSNIDFRDVASRIKALKS